MKRLLTLFVLAGLASTLIFTQPAHAQSDITYNLIEMVNAYRASVGLPAYQIDPSLMASAQSHTDYEASTGQITHVGEAGHSFNRFFMRVNSHNLTVILLITTQHLVAVLVAIGRGADHRVGQQAHRCHARQKAGQFNRRPSGAGPGRLFSRQHFPLQTQTLSRQFSFQFWMSCDFGLESGQFPSARSFGISFTITP